jgi:hypothetical protein
MKHVKPIKLEDLIESLIIVFAYQPEQRRFTIISDYFDRSPASERELIALVFNGVHRFHRERGDLPRLAHTHHRYVLREEQRSIVFQHIKTRNREGGPNEVSFWFGPSMGGVDFEYQDLDVYQRGSRAIGNLAGTRIIPNRRDINAIHDEDNDFTHFDVVTNEVFDFYNPFPQLLDVKKRKK